MSDLHFNNLNDELEHELLQNRILFFAEGVSAHSTSDAIRRLWYLEMKNPGKNITFVINSPGGSVDAGFSLWDQAKMISSPVTTLVTGLAASMGSILSLCASPGRRFATENARIMIHQPLISGRIQGSATDLEIHAREILKTREHIAQVYVDATGKSMKEIEETIERDTWFSAKEAMEFGLLDKIVTKFDEIRG